MRRLLFSAWIPAFLVSCALAGSCVHHQVASHPTARPDRRDAIRRSQVWAETDIAAKDLMAGPKGPGAFAPGETVTCDYTAADMNGRSPKFMCLIAGKDKDEIKVKYGRDNPEVYGEVLATRLLWALGFGADRMYPVRVVCHGCPASIKAGDVLPSGDRLFDPAAVERKAPGREIESFKDQGWAWPALDLVAAEAGGAPVAQRDALKLLAVFMQHADSKPDNQRLVCLDPRAESAAASEKACEHPFMLIQDLGLTFGRTTTIFHKVNFVSLARWKSTPVWATGRGCTGDLRPAMQGTLKQPPIGEEGRQFLANLLGQLTDAQLRDLFTAARVTLRPGGDTVDDWVTVFKHKRQEVQDRRCPPASPASSK